MLCEKSSLTWQESRTMKAEKVSKCLKNQNVLETIEFEIPPTQWTYGSCFSCQNVYEKGIMDKISEFVAQSYVLFRILPVREQDGYQIWPESVWKLKEHSNAIRYQTWKSRGRIKLKLDMRISWKLKSNLTQSKWTSQGHIFLPIFKLERLLQAYLKFEGV